MEALSLGLAAHLGLRVVERSSWEYLPKLGKLVSTETALHLAWNPGSLW